MIAKIVETTQFGKDGKAGISMLSCDEGGSDFYAHSVQDAVEWALKFPLYEDSMVETLLGKTIITSKWNPYDSSFDNLLLEENNPRHGAKYSRSQLVIIPVSTIYENTGFSVHQK